MAQQIILETMQWSSLSDISDVRPVQIEDFAVLDELRLVLDKHGAGERFGIHLIHKHFDVADDEVLVEYTDEEARTLNCRVEKRDTLGNSPALLETQWRFNTQKASMICHGYCNIDHGHSRKHQYK